MEIKGRVIFLPITEGLLNTSGCLLKHFKKKCVSYLLPKNKKLEFIQKEYYLPLCINTGTFLSLLKLKLHIA